MVVSDGFGFRKVDARKKFKKDDEKGVKYKTTLKGVREDDGDTELKETESAKKVSRKGYQKQTQTVISEYEDAELVRQKNSATNMAIGTGGLVYQKGSLTNTYEDGQIVEQDVHVQNLKINGKGANYTNQEHIEIKDENGNVIAAKDNSFGVGVSGSGVNVNGASSRIVYDEEGKIVNQVDRSGTLGIGSSGVGLNVSQTIAQRDEDGVISSSTQEFGANVGGGLGAHVRTEKVTVGPDGEYTAIEKNLGAGVYVGSEGVKVEAQAGLVKNENGEVHGHQFVAGAEINGHGGKANVSFVNDGRTFVAGAELDIQKEETTLAYNINRSDADGKQVTHEGQLDVKYEKGVSAQYVQDDKFIQDGYVDTQHLEAGVGVYKGVEGNFAKQVARDGNVVASVDAEGHIKGLDSSGGHYVVDGQALVDTRINTEDIYSSVKDAVAEIEGGQELIKLIDKAQKVQATVEGAVDGSKGAGKDAKEEVAEGSKSYLDGLDGSIQEFIERAVEAQGVLERRVDMRDEVTAAKDRVNKAINSNEETSLAVNSQNENQIDMSAQYRAAQLQH